MAKDGFGNTLPRVLARCAYCGQATRGYRLVAKPGIRLDGHRREDVGLPCWGDESVSFHVELELVRQ